MLHNYNLLILLYEFIVHISKVDKNKNPMEEYSFVKLKHELFIKNEHYERMYN